MPIDPNDPDYVVEKNDDVEPEVPPASDPTKIVIDPKESAKAALLELISVSTTLGKPLSKEALLAIISGNKKDLPIIEGVDFNTPPLSSYFGKLKYVQEITLESAFNDLVNSGDVTIDAATSYVSRTDSQKTKDKVNSILGTSKNALSVYDKYKRVQFMEIFDTINFGALPKPLQALIVQAGGQFGITPLEIAKYWEVFAVTKNLYDLAKNGPKAYDSLPPELKTKLARSLGVKESYLGNIVKVSGKLTDIATGKSNLSAKGVFDEAVSTFREDFLNEFAPGASNWSNFDKLDPKLQKIIAVGLGFIPDSDPKKDGVKKLSETIKKAKKFEESMKQAISLKNSIIEKAKTWDSIKDESGQGGFGNSALMTEAYDELALGADTIQAMHEDVAITKDPYSDLKDSLGSVPEVLGGSDPEWRDKVGAAPAPEPSTKTTEPIKTTVDDIKGDKSIADLIKSLIEKKAIITGANTGIIQSDGSVDWKGDIKFTAAALTSDGKLPFKFGVVDSVFDCSGIGLKSLEGAPKVVGSVFNCSKNELESLVGGPEKCFAFWANDNKLGSGTGLKFGPKEVTGVDISKNTISNGVVYDISGNRLTSFSGGESLQILGGGIFDCSENLLTSLTGMTQIFSKGVSGFNCQNNKLTSLEGHPIMLGDRNGNYGDFICSSNPITQFPTTLADISCRNFECKNAELKTLSYLPKLIDGDCYITGNIKKFDRYSAGIDRSVKNGGLELGDYRIIEIGGKLILDGGVFNEQTSYPSIGKDDTKKPDVSTYIIGDKTYTYVICSGQGRNQNQSRANARQKIWNTQNKNYFVSLKPEDAGYTVEFPWGYIGDDKCPEVNP